MANDQRSGGSSSSCSSKKNKNNNNNNSPTSNNNNNNGGENKPKQPQRGLGVAQLEKIRLHTQLANCGFIPHQHPAFSPYPTNPFQHVHQEEMRYHQAAAAAAAMGYVPAPGVPSPYGYLPNNFMMGMGEHMERTGNNRFGESQPSMTPRWIPNNNMYATPESQYQFMQPQGLVTRHLLSNVEQNNNDGSSSQNSNLNSENEDIDLDLKLSL